MKKEKDVYVTEWDSLIKACILIDTTLSEKLEQVRRDRAYYEAMKIKDIIKNGK